MSDEEDPNEVVAEIRVRVHRGGALSVVGPIDDPAWCIAALENAKDAVRNHARPKKELVIPAKDVTLP